MMATLVLNSRLNIIKTFIYFDRHTRVSKVRACDKRYVKNARLIKRAASAGRVRRSDLYRRLLEAMERKGVVITRLPGAFKIAFHFSSPKVRRTVQATSTKTGRRSLFQPFPLSRSPVSQRLLSTAHNYRETWTIRTTTEHFLNRF